MTVPSISLSALLTDPESALGYRVREPAPAHPSSLLVLLHGVGGNETNLAGMAGHIPPDTLVVLARGRLPLGPGQYAWFRVAFTAAGPRIVAHEAEESRLALIDFIAHLQTLHGIAPGRTVVAGFSQGGILSASVGLTAPERVQGFAVLAGRILPELEPVLASREHLSRLRALIAHGRDDDKLPLSWAERAHAWLDELGIAHELRIYPGGHGVSAVMAADFHDWVRPILLPPADKPLTLHLGDTTVELVQRADESEKPNENRAWCVAPGLDVLVREHLAPAGSMAFKIEAAIAAIEDQLACAPTALHGAAVTSHDPQVLEIARVAGLDATATTLHREAVEQVFQRLSAAALVRPSTASADPRFAASVLLLRELMHHLDIASITLARRT